MNPVVITHFATSRPARSYTQWSSTIEPSPRLEADVGVAMKVIRPRRRRRVGKSWIHSIMNKRKPRRSLGRVHRGRVEVDWERGEKAKFCLPPTTGSHRRSVYWIIKILTWISIIFLCWARTPSSLFVNFADCSWKTFLQAVFSSKVFLLANTHLIVVVILAHLDRRFASLLIPRIMSNSLFPFLCVIYSDHKNEFFTHETFFSWRSTDSRRVPNKDNPQISFLLATLYDTQGHRRELFKFQFLSFSLTPSVPTSAREFGGALIHSNFHLFHYGVFSSLDDYHRFLHSRVVHLLARGGFIAAINYCSRAHKITVNKN